MVYYYSHLKMKSQPNSSTQEEKGQKLSCQDDRQRYQSENIFKEIWRGFDLITIRDRDRIFDKSHWAIAS
jgi:hypothetical protein